jgi:YaiO family outer membrane protein
MRFCFYITLVSISFFATVSAQDQHGQDVDEAFAVARKKAFDGNYPEAREMLHVILSHAPDYDDVRIFLARTYAWEKDFGKAKEQLDVVLQKHPENVEALSALVDVEMWGNNHEAAIQAANRGLVQFPNSEHFLYCKAQSLYHLKRLDEASEPLVHLLLINPSHLKGLTLQKELRDAAMKYTAGFLYGIDFFSRLFGQAHYVSAQIGRNNRWGTSIFRLNYVSRFSKTGIQPEIELYPKLSNGVYLYLNYGLSPYELFPNHRGGAELYSKLPKHLEASLGIRYLKFYDDVLIYTGTITKYFNHFYLSYRPSVIPGSDQVFSSHQLTLRHYFKTTDNYISLSAGIGFLPDERRIQTWSSFAGASTQVLHSQRGGIYWQQILSDDFIMITNVEIVHQELFPELNEFVEILSISVGFKKRF